MPAARHRVSVPGGEDRHPPRAVPSACSTQSTPGPGQAMPHPPSPWQGQVDSAPPGSSTEVPCICVLCGLEPLGVPRTWPCTQTLADCQVPGSQAWPVARSGAPRNPCCPVLETPMLTSRNSLRWTSMFLL